MVGLPKDHICWVTRRWRAHWLSLTRGHGGSPTAGKLAVPPWASWLLGCPQARTVLGGLFLSFGRSCRTETSLYDVECQPESAGAPGDAF